MSATADHAEGVWPARLGFRKGQVVQELGYDDDCDDDLRTAIADITGSELVDEDYDDVVDSVLLWWREDDGDLVDATGRLLVSLGDGGVVWLLTRRSAGTGTSSPATSVTRLPRPASTRRAA